ncbi:methyltransferase, FxLD system [[Kitasatospora] papulosa]|uniref:methyltransferase, FxLD system n=1 Tax=[Kitasatospora] papulosa TaxID=1464011 RepID=UPI0037F92D79
MGTTRTDWSKHYTQGRGFRRLGNEEKTLLVEHAPAPEGGRALDVGCGTGEMSVYLASLGYQVDALDAVDAALARARTDHPDAKVRWLHLDIERDDPAPLDDTLYDLVVFRMSVAFLNDRTRILHALGRQLREDGTMLVISPLAASTSAEKRHIALDEDEISALTCGWTSVQRIAVGDSAALVLHGPCADTVATERSVPATGYAVAGALTVVTDEHGRVLLGWSKRGMWEIPGGKIEGAEPLDEAGVRELAEETGLHATGATAVTILTDAAQGVPRLTAVIRIAGVTGTLTTAEPQKFTRWEWHDLHGLGCLGPVFTPSAQALNAVWPGVIPALPPVNAYPTAAELTPAPGEPAEAVRLRHRMADAVIAGGWAPSAVVQEALRTVPRHRFAPETDLKTAYDDDLAVVTRRDVNGRATSSVSAAWLQADMAESLALMPGAIAFEAGSGGYNAELLAHVVGPDGRVITVDIDPWVARRTRRFTEDAGSRRVTAVHADGALGAPAHLVPRGGFDAGVITYSCWDIAPAWRTQLAQGGRLVLPLEIGGYSRAITFERRGEVLHALGFTFCGFVRDQGQNARDVPVVDLLDGELSLRFEHGTAAATDGMEAALRGDRLEVSTGVTMTGASSYFGSLQLYLATTLPGFCRLAAHREPEEGVTEVAKGRDVPAIIADASLAYPTYVQSRNGTAPEEKEYEWVIHAFGEQGPQLAEHLLTALRFWDRHLRAADNNEHTDPVLTVYPAGTLDEDLPAGHVVDKRHCRMVFTWPKRPEQFPAGKTTIAPVREPA